RDFKAGLLDIFDSLVVEHLVRLLRILGDGVLVLFAVEAAACTPERYHQKQRSSLDHRSPFGSENHGHNSFTHARILTIPEPSPRRGPAAAFLRNFSSDYPSQKWMTRLPPTRPLPLRFPPRSPG